MKYIICICILFFNLSLASQCPSEEIEFHTQEALDSFPLLYPNCNKLNYKLSIGVFNADSDIHDLSPLAQVDSLNLFYVTNCDSLSDLKQLSHVKYLKGINVNRSEKIVNLQGLENVTNNLFHLGIFDNESIISLEGLDNMGPMIHNIGIERNPALNSIESLINIQDVEYRITIADCPKLESLNGLNQLKTIGDFFKLQELGIRSMEGLDSLRYIHRDFRIANNDSLTSFHGMPMLTTIGPDEFHGVFFDIIGNKSIESLEGLENVKEITLNFKISANAKLASLKGLENLENSYGYFRIANHLSLNDIWAISDNTFVGSNLSFLDNFMLEECAVPSVCAYILSDRPYYAEDNLGYCDSEETLKAKCLSLIDNDGDGYGQDVDCDDDEALINPGAVEIPDNEFDENCDGIIATTTSIDELMDFDFIMYPNPAAGYIILQSKNVNENLEVGIFNSFGKLVQHANYQNSQMSIKLILQDLPTGVYHVQITQNKYLLSKKLLVE